MPKLSDEAKRKKAEYDRQYQQDNVSRMSIFFNKGNPEDVDMMDWLDKKGKRNKSGYVKGLIREDMHKAGK